MEFQKPINTTTSNDGRKEARQPSTRSCPIIEILNKGFTKWDRYDNQKHTVVHIHRIIEA